MKKQSPQQKERLAEYIRMGLSAREIADREGSSIDDPSYMNRQLKKLAKTMGISRDNVVPYTVAYGLTDESKSLRYRLAYRLADLIDKHGKDETARITGLSSIRQRDAMKGEGRAPIHNWTLAQIERLARASGLTLTELLEQATLDYRTGQAWPKKAPTQL